jgi:hypothetical protein
MWITALIKSCAKHHAKNHFPQKIKNKHVVLCVRSTDFFNLVCDAFGNVATPGLLCQPRVIVKMIAEKQMECRLVGETEVLGDNLPQHHFCPSQNPTWADPGLNPGRRCGKPATKRQTYGAAKYRYTQQLSSYNNVFSSFIFLYSAYIWQRSF